ncbi:MAG TPA: MinD/ParA family protein [Oligoflexia bacterium]|nr:MinD/ParA family protein [Oligoflexia bacterium]
MSSSIGHKPAKVISVTSGKGGVGKTHTTINLGLALCSMGKRVLLLDADLGLANINIMLGFKPAATLHDVLSGGAAIRDILVRYTDGLDVIPAASGIPEMVSLGEDEKASLISGFDEFATDYDYVLVDTAAGIGDSVLYFNAAAEQVLVVIDPEPTSITDAYALIKVMAAQWSSKEFDVIVNRVPVGSDGRGPFAKLAAAAGKFLPVSLNYMGAIAEDDSLVDAVMKQTPLLKLYPNARASRDIYRLAKKISANEGSRTPKGGLQFFFRSLLEQGA